MKLNSLSPSKARLPLMQNFEVAAGLAEQEKDPFYLAAFMLQCWLGGLVLHANAEYAEKKNPWDRSIQNGQVWTSQTLQLLPEPAEHDS